MGTRGHAFHRESHRGAVTDSMTPPVDSLLHLTDFHFWEIVLNPFRLLNKRFLGNANVVYRRRREFVTANARPFADAAIATGLRHALLSGDFSSTATDRELAQGAEFVRYLAQCGLDVTVIPGNHDVYTFESVRRKRFENYFGEWLPPRGLPHAVRLPGGTPLLLVPTVCPNWLSSEGTITDIEIEAVGTHLDACSSPLIVCGHYPVLTKTHGYESSPSRRLRNADALRDALGRSGKRVLYVSGHVHRFSYVRDDRYPALEHLTTGAFFRHARETHSDGEFSEIHVHGDGFGVVRHRHATEWEQREIVAGGAPFKSGC